MNRRDLVQAYLDAVFDTDKDDALGVVASAMASGMTPEEVVFEVVIPATEEAMAAITEDADANLAHLDTVLAEAWEQCRARRNEPEP